MKNMLLVGHDQKMMYPDPDRMTINVGKISISWHGERSSSSSNNGMGRGHLPIMAWGEVIFQ